ncbi:MAG TPA: ATP-binding protein [Chlamydiales bacterium]|nr:ATP-binding protein [Chlamydiales bacterium]
MDLITLEKIATCGESVDVEFKKSTSDLAGACESLCGMLNAGIHGHVFIGISGGKLVGQEISDQTQQEIAKCLKEFSPDPHIAFSLFPFSGKRKLIHLTAKSKLDHLPYFFRGKAYLRVGTTTSLLSRDRLITFVMDQQRRSHPYDALETTDHSLADLDTEWIHRAVELGIGANRLPVAARGTPKEILTKFELLKGNLLTHAAVILFGKAGHHIPLSCTLMMARFKGIEKGEFLDHKQFVGNAFEILDEGMMFLSRHLPLRGRFEKNNIRRIDEPLIPTEALREALLNAICHRDYEHPGASIHLAIYDDRVEIVSTGGFMPGIQAGDLKKPHNSILRNRLIAQTFYYTGLVEKWGQGTLKIAKLCADFKLPEPEFFDHPLWVGIILRAPIVQHKTLEPVDTQSRQEKILEVLRLHKKLTIKELHTILPHVPRRTLQWELQMLKNSKVVDVSGIGTSSTLWTLREE